MSQISPDTRATRAAPAHGSPRRALTPWTVTLGILALGSLVFWLGVIPLASPSRLEPLLGFVFFAGFYVAETSVLHVWLGKERRSFSLSDIATISAVFFLGPVQFVIVGSVAMAFCMYVDRGQRGVKLAFNTSQTFAKLSLMAWLFYLLGPGQHPTDPAAWMAALAGLVVSEVFAFVSITLAISSLEGPEPRQAMLKGLLFAMAIVAANGSLGILAVTAMHHSVIGLLMVATPSALLVAAYRDMLARREAEAKLTEARLMYETILDSVQGTIYVKDLAGRYVYVNRRFVELFDLRVDDVLGRTDREMFPAAQVKTWRTNDARVLETLEPVTEEEQAELSDGTHTFLSMKFPLIDANGKAYALGGISTDISERKLIDERVRQSQKLEAVGELAGGVAHDFNNLLAVISNYASFALEDLAAGETKAEDLQQILKASTKAAALTRRLLTFSRREPASADPVDLNGLVKEMERLLRRTLKENIRITTQLAPELPLVLADASRMELLLMNISVNAADAMPQGGELVLSTRATTIEPPGSQALNLQAGDYVVLRIADTGAGMTPEVKARLFEPFFTTKGTGKGTGMGLATVYAIVEASGGKIHVDSTPGEGTTFTIFFPAMTVASVEEPVDRSVPAASRKVLVVEDQEAVAEVVFKILERKGYSVVRASSGAEAIDLARDEEFDALVTDVIMPEMNGPELAARLGLPTLFMSGYSDGELPGDRVTKGEVILLHKPFTQAQLLDKLQEVFTLSR